MYPTYMCLRRCTKRTCTSDNVSTYMYVLYCTNRTAITVLDCSDVQYVVIYLFVNIIHFTSLGLEKINTDYLNGVPLLYNYLCLFFAYPDTNYGWKMVVHLLAESSSVRPYAYLNFYPCYYMLFHKTSVNTTKLLYRRSCFNL